MPAWHSALADSAMIGCICRLVHALGFPQQPDSLSWIRRCIRLYLRTWKRAGIAAPFLFCRHVPAMRAKWKLCRDFSAQTDAYQRLDALAAEAQSAQTGSCSTRALRRRNTSRQSGASGCISGDSARKPQRGSSARGAGRHRTGSFRDMGKLFQPHSYAGRTAYYRRQGQKCTVAGDFCRNIRN